MEWVTTTTLLQRLENFEDREVWDRLIERFRRPLAAFCRRFGLTDAEADDVVQETLLGFADAYRRGKYDRDAGRLSSWLFGIAYRQASNARRKRARDAARNADVGQTAFLERVPDEAEAQSAWDADWEKAMLDTCMAQLKAEVAANTYQVFEQVVRAERDPAQVAAELGMTRDAIYVAKHRVLKRLGELVREYERLSDGAGA